MSLYKRLVIRKIVPETPGTKTFILEPLGPEDRFPYKAGQFLTLVFHSRHGEERRSFSISSSPFDNEPLSITVKRVDNGAYSRLLTDKAVEGDVLNSIGASGFFVLPERPEAYRQIFFFAAGSGITPIFSLVRTLLFSGYKIPIVLIYSNRQKETTIFYEALLQLQQQFPEVLQIEFLFSTAPDLSRARLSKWLLPMLLSEYQAATDAETLCYLCGPFDYMRMASIVLLAKGIPAANLRKEDFLPLKMEPKQLPPDTDPHRVMLELNETTHILELQYPDTILKAARKAGLEMPYSCEAGRCGTCVARCLSGKVWMSYNEVLVDEDLAKGLVLTCTAYPVGGDVRLEI